MSSLAFSVLFVVFFLLTLGLRFWLANRQIRHVLRHRERVPAEFAEKVSLEAHRKAADYTVARTRFGIVALLWGGAVLIGFTLLGGLQAIDNELLDAAAVDGASSLRRFWDVTLPGLRPVAATVILLGIIWTFNMFAVIFLITQGGPADATQILVTYSYRYFLDYQLYGVAAAYGVLILSILLVFATVYKMTVRRLGEESW